MAEISLRIRTMEMSGRGGSSISESYGGRVEQGRRVWDGDLLRSETTRARLMTSDSHHRRGIIK